MRQRWSGAKSACYCKKAHKKIFFFIFFFKFEDKNQNQGMLVEIILGVLVVVFLSCAGGAKDRGRICP
jgi:hypothetical protein